MLKIDNLSIMANNSLILDKLSLTVEAGDVVCILGQNGEGKSTLLKAIMGHTEYIMTKGNILYNNILLNKLSINERAHLGIFMANQNPIEIEGISMLDFFKSIYQEYHQTVNVLSLYKTIDAILKKVGLPNDVLTRSINVGFSGGEKKKSEMAQMLLIAPKLILLDEIDSGLDIDATQTITNLLLEAKANKKTIIFVTHHEELIKQLQPNKVILIANQHIVAQGGMSLAEQITQHGYKQTLAKLGIKKAPKTVNDCVGKHFEK